MELIAGIFSLFTSGAGGGIIGGIFGLFKSRQERKERVEMAKVALKRDEMEYKNASEERKHALLMLDKTGEIEVEKIQSETEAEIEVAHQRALGNAQDALKNLNTSSWMDNFRASVRPVLAYWGTILFTIMLVWGFLKYNELITPEEGKQLLISMFGTLTFIVSSIITFYYVSRRNKAP